MKVWGIAILAVLVLGPAVKADTFDVTSGFIQVYGGNGVSSSLSGDGFTASGNMSFAGACPETVMSGGLVFGCDPGLDPVSGELTMNTGATVGFGENIWTDIEAAPMIVNGGDEITLSEAATIGPLVGCDNAGAFPACNFTTFLITGNVLLTMVLDRDEFSGDCFISSETYTISDPPVNTPELNSLTLLALGLAAVLGWTRYRKGIGWDARAR